MELKIAKSVDGPLLKRKHVTATVTFVGEKTPSNKDALAALAKATGASEDVIAIRRIATQFGSSSATVDAYVYESKEILAKTESRPKKKVVAAPAGG